MNDTTTKTKSGDDLILQPDDREIVRLLSKEFLLLITEQICQLFPMRPLRALNRRLDKMVRAGYLYRRSPTTFGMNTRRSAYYVAPKAFELFDPGVTESSFRLRSRRARYFSDTDLPHLIFANSVQIKFHTANREYPDYQVDKWIPQYNPLWSNLAGSGLHVQPDGFVKFQKADRTFLCFIEVDRATYRGKPLDNRLDLYAGYAFQDYPSSATSDFKHPRFRVLFITEGQKRTTRLLERLHKYHPDLFWVTSWADFSSHPLLESYWRTHDSSRRHALDEPYILPSELPEPPSPPLPDPVADIPSTYV